MGGRGIIELHRLMRNSDNSIKQAMLVKEPDLGLITVRAVDNACLY